MKYSVYANYSKKYKILQGITEYSITRVNKWLGIKIRFGKSVISVAA